MTRKDRERVMIEHPYLLSWLTVCAFAFILISLITLAGLA